MDINKTKIKFDKKKFVIRKNTLGYYENNLKKN